MFHNSAVNKRDHVLAYLCEIDGEFTSVSTNVEIAEIGYFDLDNLPEDTDPGTVRRMREFVEDVEKDETW